MKKRSQANEFLKRNRLVDRGRVIWNDDTKAQFALTITKDGLKRYQSPFNYVTAQLLEQFPRRRREEIKEIFLGDEFWTVENGLLAETFIFPF